MAISLTHTISELRWGDEFTGYGDQWTGAAMVVWFSPYEVEIRLAVDRAGVAGDHGIPLAKWFEIMRLLYDEGVKILHFTRYKNGEPRKSTIDLEKKLSCK